MNMKSIAIFVLIIAVMFCLTSCAPIEVEGLEEYSPALSSSGLTSYLFPSEDFLTQFAYVDGTFNYVDMLKYDDECLEKAMAVLKYDEETYEQVKQYCLTSMDLSDSEITYGGYVFLENYQHAIAYDNFDGEKNNRFPYFFTMIGYNDSLKEMFFFGLECGENYHVAAQLIYSDCGAFLNEFYSEYYSFSE